MEKQQQQQQKSDQKEKIDEKPKNDQTKSDQKVKKVAVVRPRVVRKGNEMAAEQQHMEVDFSADDNDGAPSLAARLSSVEKNQKSMLLMLTEQKELLAKLLKIVADKQ
ncbi:hypothetical protein niasHT_034978 [Heterodera trifolii]|uniref:Uncharacterized protein n=1 Tax=Heterodera trifolii TaxID=157864 RepID=A0ABD2IDR3_9BILA